jgi:hypothetical protein
MAEDDDGAVLFGEPIEFLMENVEVFLSEWFRGGTRRHLVDLPRGFTSLLPRGTRPGADGDTPGDAVEPGTEGVATPDRARLADQDEESGLEGVLGVVDVGQRAASDAPDHRPVQFHQRGEGQLGGGALPFEELVEQLAVGHAGDGPRVDQGLDGPNNRTPRTT